MKKLLFFLFFAILVLVTSQVNTQTVYYYSWDDSSAPANVIGVSIDTVRITGDTIIMVYERTVVWDTTRKILVNSDDIVFWTDETVTYDPDSFKISIDVGPESHYFFIPFDPGGDAFRVSKDDVIAYFCTCGQVNFDDPDSWAWNINGCGNSFEKGKLDCKDLGTHCSENIGCQGSAIIGSSLAPGNNHGGGIIIKATFLASPGP